EVSYHLLPARDRVPERGAAEDVVFHMIAAPPLNPPVFSHLDVDVDYQLATLSQRFGLEIALLPGAGAISGVCRYASDLVDEQLVRNVTDRYTSLLAEVAGQ